MADSETRILIEQAKAQQRPFRLADRVVRRHVLLAADTERLEWVERCKDVIRFVRPDLIAWIWDNVERGEKAGQYMHTSKPFTDALKSADGFCGNAFGDSNWVLPSMPDVLDLLQEEARDVVQKWFQDCSKWLTGLYRHGTYMMIQPAVALDALTIGDALTYTSEEDREIYHKHCNIMDAYLRRGHDLKLRIVHYQEHYMAGEAYEHWGDRLSPATCQAAISEPTRRVTIIRCVYRFTDAIFEGIDGLDAKTLDDSQPVTHYEVLIEKDSPKNATAYDSKDPLSGVLEHHPYRENPFSDWPYWLNNQENYGWSPDAAAIISIKRQHAIYKGITNAAQQATDPAMKASLGLKNKIDLRPGRVSYLPDTNAILEETYGRSVAWPFGIEFLERHESELEEVLSLSLYQAMTMRTKEMTVPEVLEVIGEKARMLSPRLGTYQHLYANPIHDRVYALARKLKVGPIAREPPWLGQFVRDQHLDPKIVMVYRGPLAQASEQVLVQRSVMTTVSLLAAVAQFGDKAAVEVQDQIKAGRLAEHIMDDMDLYQDVIASETEVKEAQQQRQDLIRAQMEAETNKVNSEAMRNTAQTAAVLAGPKQGGRAA